MSKIRIPFQSQEGQKEFLEFNLYDHSIARKWKSLVLKAQLMGGHYASEDIFFGDGFSSAAELEALIREEIAEMSSYFPEIWNRDEFHSLRTYFPLDQAHLNLAHLFFELAFEQQTKNDMSPFPLNPVIREGLRRLNYGIHKMEFLMHGGKGFFIDTRFSAAPLRLKIDRGENALFTLDRKWGEMYLSYCHIGESYLEVFNNKHVAKAVPQTEISGDFILSFQPDTSFDRKDDLKDWLTIYFGEEVTLGDLPLGYVPLGYIRGNWTEESIFSFFKWYPFMDKKILFD